MYCSGDWLKERVNKRISDANKGCGSLTTFKDLIEMKLMEISQINIRTIAVRRLIEEVRDYSA